MGNKTKLPCGKGPKKAVNKPQNQASWLHRKSVR